jgi:hypothetical protein
MYIKNQSKWSENKNEYIPGFINDSSSSISLLNDSNDPSLVALNLNKSEHFLYFLCYV